jgi:prophage regulatory protein
MKNRPTPLAQFDTLPGEAFVDVQTVAMLLGTTPSTVWRWSANGTLPKPSKLGPQSTRWQVSAIRAALSKLTA